MADNKNDNVEYRKDSWSSPFNFVLPPERLGKECRSYEEFRQLLEKDRLERIHRRTDLNEEIKHYTLIIITEPEEKRILLGYKNRGFGKGLTVLVEK